MRFVCLTPIELKHKPIVCHKYCVKKLETTRNSLRQRKDLQACFGVSYDEVNRPDILCSAWCRGIYYYNTTRNTYSHADSYIYCTFSKYDYKSTNFNYCIFN